MAGVPPGLIPQLRRAHMLARASSPAMVLAVERYVEIAGQHPEATRGRRSWP